MLKTHPGLKDRLEALAAFTGIALGAVAGVELVIGAGFDPLMPGDEVREVAPSAYVQVAEGFWDSQARVIPLSSTEPYFMGDDYVQYAVYDEQELAGGYADRDAPASGYPDASDMDALYAEIEALYAENADFAADSERDYDSSWRSGEGARYVDEMNVADDMGEQGYGAGGYADAIVPYEDAPASDEPEMRGAPAPDELQAVEPTASETAAPL
jgi:hypothetical protein